MAKVNGLYGKMRGKYGGGVFSVIKGQNILREYNPEPANPRSYAQQAQRALLANMTKFYKRGTQNFFKFAFEDKTTRESDFNAFARNNMQAGCYFTKALYDNPAAPALGEFLLTKGSLDVGVVLQSVGDYATLNVPLRSAATTIGDLSTFFLSRENALVEGDICTMVFTDAGLVPGNEVQGTEPPTWETIQFYLDRTDTTPLSSLGLSVVPDENETGDYYLLRDLNGVDRASFCAMVFSRNTPDGLLVSTTPIRVSAAAAAILDWNRGEYARRQAAISWGGNPEAFLAGGNLTPLPALTAITVGPYSSSPYAYGLGVFAIEGASTIKIGATATGSGLKTTAQGGNWSFTFYDATLYVGDTGIYRLRRTVALTATGTATSISLMGDIAFGDVPVDRSMTQGYGLLSYNGVPVWWGVMTPASA